VKEGVQISSETAKIPGVASKNTAIFVNVYIFEIKYILLYFFCLG